MTDCLSKAQFFCEGWLLFQAGAIVPMNTTAYKVEQLGCTGSQGQITLPLFSCNSTTPPSTCLRKKISASSKQICRWQTKKEVKPH